MPSCYHGNTLIQELCNPPGRRRPRRPGGAARSRATTTGSRSTPATRSSSCGVRQPPAPLVHVVALGSRTGRRRAARARARRSSRRRRRCRCSSAAASARRRMRALSSTPVSQRVVVGTAAFGDDPAGRVRRCDRRPARRRDRRRRRDRADGGLARVVRADDRARRSSAAPTPASRPSSAPRSTATARAAALTSSCCARCVRGFAGACSPPAASATRADVQAVRDLGLDGVVVGRAWLDGTLRPLAEQQREQRLLHVQPVLGLVPDRRALAVEHLRR